MSAAQLHTKSIRIFRGRRLAIAAALAAGAVSGAVVTSANRVPETTAQMSSSALSMPAPHSGATSVSFVRRIRGLEARGYMQAACTVDGGELLFNPRTHRYVTVRA